MNARNALTVTVAMSVGLWALTPQPVSAGITPPPKLYWINEGGDMYESDLDGSNQEFVAGIAYDLRDFDLAIDHEYYFAPWAYVVGGELGQGAIWEVSLPFDPSPYELLTGLTSPWGIAVEFDGSLLPKLFWTDDVDGTISLLDMDTWDLESNLVTGLNEPRGIDLHVSHGKIYWASAGDGKIQRANLDGSNVEDVVTGLSSPTGLTVDEYGDKVYWTEPDTGAIKRANLDGSNIDTIGSDHPFAWSADVDRFEPKVYWTGKGTEMIKRQWSTGFEQETIVVDIDLPIAIKLNKMRLPGPDLGIPALSEWGVIVLALLVVATGTLVCRRNGKLAQ